MVREYMRSMVAEDELDRTSDGQLERHQQPSPQAATASSTTYQGHSTQTADSLQFHKYAADVPETASASKSIVDEYMELYRRKMDEFQSAVDVATRVFIVVFSWAP